MTLYNIGNPFNAGQRTRRVTRGASRRRRMPEPTPTGLDPATLQAFADRLQPMTTPDRLGGLRERLAALVAARRGGRPVNIPGPYRDPAPSGAPQPRVSYDADGRPFMGLYDVDGNLTGRRDIYLNPDHPRFANPGRRVGHAIAPGQQRTGPTTRDIGALIGQGIGGALRLRQLGDKMFTGANRKAMHTASQNNLRRDAGLNSMAEGGVVGGLADLIERKYLERAAQGKAVEGPALLLVGEGRDGSGVAEGHAEAVLAAPGTVVAPLDGEEPTRENIINALAKEMAQARVARAATGTTVDGRSYVLRNGQWMWSTPDGRWGYSRGPGAGSGSGSDNDGAPVPAPAAPAPAPAAPAASAPAPAPAPPPAPASAGTSQMTEQATTAALTPIRAQMNRGRLYDVLGPGTDMLRQQLGGVPSLAQYRRLSNSQRGAMQSTLSAHGIAPEDFEEYMTRVFEGFNPVVQSGQRARFGGVLR